MPEDPDIDDILAARGVVTAEMEVITCIKRGGQVIRYEIKLRGHFELQYYSRLILKRLASGDSYS